MYIVCRKILLDKMGLILINNRIGRSPVVLASEANKAAREHNVRIIFSVHKMWWR